VAGQQARHGLRRTAGAGRQHNMSVIHPRAGRNAVHTVHRVGAAVVGGFLVLFAIVSLSQPLQMLSGPVVMGLNMLGFHLTNVIFSLAVGLVLGAYGRLTGSLPADSPYATPSPAATTPPAVDATAA
jgi:hypothetical protein